MVFTKRFLKKTIQELEHAKLNQYPRFRLSGEFIAKVVKVYDGDTITIVMRTEPKKPFFQYSVRMYGYDSPELRPDKEKDYSESIFKDRQDEIKQAKNARDYLRSMILDKIVVVNVIPDDDKYGRLLCDVFRYPHVKDSYTCINAEMIKKGFGYEYSGGTKRK